VTRDAARGAQLVADPYKTTYSGPMQISAVKFKATCLKLIDQVAETGEPVIITKRGKVLARLVSDHGKPRGLGKGRGSAEILCSDEDLFQLGAGEPWNAGT
jgi:prevent-host-death family protein